MSIAVISDLHLGPGDRSDVFRHEDEQFLRFLSFLEQSFERIVLLGDVWETLTPAWPFDPVQALRRAREAHPEIARRFERPQYTYIHGNHDLIAGQSEGVPEELGVWLGAWILRLGMSSVYRVLDTVDTLRSGIVPDPARCTFQRWAVGLAKHRSADVVITGHTHVPLRIEHADALFLNSGSCADGRFSFLSLDPSRGAYAVHDAW